MVTKSASRRVLVVEDEPVTRDLFVAALERAGYEVAHAADGAAARTALASSPYDLVLLDVELPGEDGSAIATHVRGRTTAAIVFVTRRADVVDRIVGLEIGGDDYIVKPPDLRELVARVKAVLRRRDEGVRPDAVKSPVAESATERLVAGWRLDRARHCLLTPSNTEVAITPGELSLLSLLLEARGRTVSREVLERAVGEAGGESRSRSLDVLIHRVRRKLGEGGSIAPRVLLTVHGVGYRLGLEAEPQT